VADAAAVVTRDEALDALRRLLRVDVLDVSRDRGDPGFRGCSPTHPAYRSPRPPQWWITVFRTRDGEPRRAATCIGPSGAIRNPKRLNGWAVRLGRSPNLPALCAEDGHQVVKLLFAITDERNDDNAR
jgi:hypothetical protein